MYMKIIVTNNDYQEILNGAWQVQFTAYDDKSLAYSLL